MRKVAGPGGTAYFVHECFYIRPVEAKMQRPLNLRALGLKEML